MFAAVVALAAAVIVLIALPGPSILYIVGQTLALGRGSAYASVVGNAAGTLTAGIVIAVFLGQALTYVAGLQAVLKVAGAIVLLALGIGYLLAARRERRLPDAAEPSEQIVERGSYPILTGWVVGVTNPKAVIIFGTIVPGFLPSGVTSTYAILTLTIVPVAVGLVVDSAWVELAHRLRGWLDRGASSIAYLKGAGGIILMVMACVIVSGI